VRRRVELAAALAAAGLAALACSSHAIAPAATPTAATATPRGAVPSGDWLRFGYDAQRSGVGPATTGITAANVGGLGVRVVHLDGTADGSAIELHAIRVSGRPRDVAVVTTTYGRTIAVDPGTGGKLWEYTPGDIGSYQGSSQITTATPIADPDRRFVYAASPDGLIHKLSVATGRQVTTGHWPARVTFDPRREKIASALNIDGADLLVTTGGYFGDAPTYEGHVAEIDRSSGRIVAVWNADCAERHYLLDPPSSCRADTSFGGSAIWARAGAVVEPGGARILVATANGPFDGTTDWGDSVLELSAGGLRLLHNWTPANQAALNSGDTDLGSTAPAILPALGGYRLAVQGGKDGQLHLLDLGRLDGTDAGPGPRLGGQLQDVGAPGAGQVFTAPAVWSHSGHVYVLVADDSGTAAYLVSGGAHPHLSVAWANGNPGTSPVLAGGLLYVYDERGGRLRVYYPGLGRQLASLPAAPGHWNSPIVVAGRVLLPTGDANDHATSGELIVYHLRGR